MKVGNDSRSCIGELDFRSDLNIFVQMLTFQIEMSARSGASVIRNVKTLITTTRMEITDAVVLKATS